MKYYSQYSQDMLVDFLVQKKNGIFLDIGANDGVSYSNSYFFEKQRNWTGLCIEPIRDTFLKLRETRSCVCLNIGVWSEKNTLKFYRANGYAEMLSGIVDSFHVEHLERLQKDVEKSGGSIETIEIDVLPLNSILTDNNIYDVDFCSIDTEGSEFEILKAINFEEFNIRIFAIENNYKQLSTLDLLKSKGYILLTRLGGDDIFVSVDFYASLNVKLGYLRFKLYQKLYSFKKRLINTFS